MTRTYLDLTSEYEGIVALRGFTPDYKPLQLELFPESLSGDGYITFKIKASLIGATCEMYEMFEVFGLNDYCKNLTRLINNEINYLRTPFPPDALCIEISTYSQNVGHLLVTVDMTYCLSVMNDSPENLIGNGDAPWNFRFRYFTEKSYLQKTISEISQLLRFIDYEKFIT